MDDVTQADPVLLFGLRKALDGPLPLQSRGRADGIFPAGRSGAPHAEKAKQTRWVEEVFEEREVTRTSKGRTTTTKKKVSVGWKITEAGRMYLAEADSPKPLLEALLKEVRRLGQSAPPSPVDSTAFVVEVERANRECLTAVEKAFAGLQKDLQAAFLGMQQAVVAAIPKPPPAPEPGPTLRMVEEAVKRIDASPVSSSPPTTSIDEEIVSFVQTWAREKSVGPPFDVLMKDLKQRRVDLSIGEFHNALRSLERKGRIKLSVWSKSIPELPEPELALFVTHKVMYYAHPTH
jgi:hypothetical protein